MRRVALLALLGSVACSSGSAIVPANFKSPVAVVPFHGYRPGEPGLGIVPLLAVASFRGGELRLVDPSVDEPVPAPNLAWPFAIPTMPRPTFLGARSLGDTGADLLVVASTGTELQLVGTWLQGPSGYGVVKTWDLAALGSVSPGAQILALAVSGVPAGPAAGTPAVAPTVPGKAWVILGVTDPSDPTVGDLVVMQMARQPDGSIALDVDAHGAPLVVVKPLKFSPGDLAVAPDNLRLYAASLDEIRDASGLDYGYGVAEIDVSAGLAAAWPVVGFDARGAPTTTVAAAFVGERTALNFYTYGQPVLRVYAALDPVGCGAEKRIACGVATFDPALRGLATDPAVPGPPGWSVPTQSYRTPMYVPALPIAFGIALPAQNPGTEAPSTPFGSQVCFSPAVAGQTLPLCPTVTEVASQPPFNATGYPQTFMDQAPDIGQLWTSVVGLTTAIDGYAYVMDLGRFGPVNGTSMLQSDDTRTQAGAEKVVGPAGPTANTSLLGFPDGTAAVGFWYDHAGVTPAVVTDADDLAAATLVWPGFTRDDHWLVSYQGVLPGLGQRRSVLGAITLPDYDDPTHQATRSYLYLAVQEASVPSQDGVLPAAGYWVPGANVGDPALGIHTVETNGLPGDLGLFLLDNDPCPSTRPNWIPASGPPAVYDATRPPLAHEAVLRAVLAPDALLFPGGALVLTPVPGHAAMDDEYQCLLANLTGPNAGKVLTAFRNVPPPNDWARGTWLRAGGFVLVGSLTGYAGRPALDQTYWLAWQDESVLAEGSEALSLARKARRFYYPSAYPNRSYSNYPLMDDPMQPGPAVGFRVGRFCLVNVPDCDATTSPPARDAGVDFYTQSGLIPMARRPYGSAGGNFVTSFDKSVFPGQEYKGTVFYSTFTGDLLMMIPPGLDNGQVAAVR